MTRYPCCSTCDNEDCDERTCVEEGTACVHGYSICETCCQAEHMAVVAS